VERGLSREEAYAAVQRAAAAAWDEHADFRAELLGQPRVAGLLSADELDALLDPGAAVGNLDAVFDRLEKLEVAS
jgi:adenylosuccinate lyase